MLFSGRLNTFLDFGRGVRLQTVFSRIEVPADAPKEGEILA